MSFHQPRIRGLRGVDDLLPGENAHVFQNAIAIDDHGQVWINALARLMQRLAGTDVPVGLGHDGVGEPLLDELTDVDRWQRRGDPHRFALRPGGDEELVMPNTVQR